MSLSSLAGTNRGREEELGAAFNHFFNAFMVHIAPIRSMTPMPIKMGDVYFNNTKTTKDKNTNILV